MFDLEAICSEVEKLDPMTFASRISEKGKSVMGGIAAVVGDEENAKTLFSALVFGAVISDGKLDEKEFGLIKPLLEEVVEEEVCYADAVEFMDGLKSQGSDYKKMISAIVEMFGAVSDELKSDIVMLCLLVCASDGKISKREKNWLAKLV
ncbi:MAG: hypothetical protein J5760_01265 [Clostridia bacterium]|nr:hypothetical protein [Clostridia bacterium]